MSEKSNHYGEPGAPWCKARGKRPYTLRDVRFVTCLRCRKLIELARADQHKSVDLSNASTKEK